MLLVSLLLAWLTPLPLPLPPAPIPAPTIGTGPDYTSGCRVSPDSRFSRDLQSAALEFGISARWLAVTVWTESGCNPYVRGSAGEIGLTQVHPRVWTASLATVGITDLWNPRENLRAGAYILSRLRRHGVEGMFRRYNGRGPKARAYARRQLALLAGP